MMWTLLTPCSSVSRQACTLGIMPASIGAAGDQLAGLVGRERVDQRLGVVLVAADAVDVAEVDELFRLQGLGDGRGGRVGVDVELLAVRGDAHRGDDRHDARVAEVFDGGAIDVGDAADVAQVDRFAVFAVELDALAEEHVGGVEVQRLGPAAEFARSGRRAAR